MSDIINANFDIYNCTDDIICIFGYILPLYFIQ